MKSSMNSTTKSRVDLVAREHGWERCIGGEHAYKKVSGGIAFRVIFSMRGSRELVLEMWSPSADYDDVVRRKITSALKPQRGESAEAYAERLFSAETPAKIAGRLVEAMGHDVDFKRGVLKSAEDRHAAAVALAGKVGAQ